MMLAWMKRLLSRSAPPPPIEPGPMDVLIMPREVGKRGSKQRRQTRWMLTVLEGDVLVSPSGAHRVARRVTRYKNGDLRSITFAIKRCSWTGRPYTILGFTDLRQQGWWPAGVNLRMDSELDVWLQADIQDSPMRCGVTCCEAKDMP